MKISVYKKLITFAVIPYLVATLTFSAQAQDSSHQSDEYKMAAAEDILYHSYATLLGHEMMSKATSEELDYLRKEAEKGAKYCFKDPAAYRTFTVAGACISKKVRTFATGLSLSPNRQPIDKHLQKPYEDKAKQAVFKFQKAYGIGN